MSHTDEDNSRRDIRFEYAWRYFALHARQRITMFYFFLIGSGIMANAYGLLLREKLHWIAAGVAIVGVLICIVSLMLDIRNHQLVRLGEQALRRIELDSIVSDRSNVDLSNPPDYMILTREDAAGAPRARLKHGVLIRFLELSVAVGFLLAAITSICFQ